MYIGPDEVSAKYSNSNRAVAPKRHWMRAVLILVAAMVAMFVGLAAISNVSTSITEEDKQVFAKMGFAATPRPATYEKEIALILAVQAKVFQLAPLGEGIPKFVDREPADLMRTGHGLCYDRSRTFDKLYSYLGFETRHVFILFKEGRDFLPALLRQGQSSHAVTEVKTSRGWLVVDSNATWIATANDGRPLDADHLQAHLAELKNPPGYLLNPYWVIRGLYSRNGQMYSPFIPFPDVNWSDLARTNTFTR